MKHEALNIDNLLGFGNDRVGADGEHYQSSNLRIGRSGMALMQNMVDVGYKNVYYDNVLKTPDNIKALATGYGHINGSDSGSSRFAFALDETGDVFGSLGGTADWELIMPLDEQESGFDPGASFREGFGIHADPKGRMQVAGYDLLATWDNETSGKVVIDGTVTNGSDKVTGSGFNTDINDDPVTLTGEIAVIEDGSDVYMYEITAQTDTELTLSATYQGSSQTDIFIWTKSNWTFQNLYSPNFPDEKFYSPMCNYESTLIIGRGERIQTLDVTTDSLSSNALDFPEGFLIRHLLVGETGILICGNFNGVGVVALWDNSANRSIAPWINFSERITGAVEFEGRFIVRTERSFYLTDGYSSQLLKTDFLDQDVYPETTDYIQTMTTTNDGFYMGLDSEGYFGKANAGLYKFNMDSKLFNHLRHPTQDLKNTKVKCVHRDAHSDRTYVVLDVDGTEKFSYIDEPSAPSYAMYISEEKAGGANDKYASGVYVDLGVANPLSDEQTITFDITCKVSDLSRQTHQLSQVKTTMTANDEIVVDETTYPQAQVGDEVVILEGNNAGQTRNITGIANAGTATATYTLDRDLDALSSSGDEFVLTPFKLVGVQSYTDEDELPEIFFDIRNDVKGRRFMVKIEIIDSQIPLEIRPSIFVYENDVII